MHETAIFSTPTIAFFHCQGALAHANPKLCVLQLIKINPTDFGALCNTFPIS
jgi:hypothetical protein